MPYDQFLEHYPRTGLRREAQLRGDAAWLEQQRDSPAAVYVMWRGQNLFSISAEKRPWSYRLRRCHGRSD
jgi:hypothetical protein